MSLTYNEFIQNILDTRGRFGVPEGEYKERHHVIPKCMGGNDDELNLIDLYAREHYEAHRLLAQENQHDKGLQFAWWTMSRCTTVRGNERYIPTSEEYEAARIAFVSCMKGDNNPMRHHIFTDEERKKLSDRAIEIFTGRTHSEDTKKKMSEASKNKPKSEDHKQALKDARKRYFDNGGKTWCDGKHLSDEHKKKIGDANRGRKPVVCRPVKCLETGEVFESVTDAHKKTGLGEETIRRSCKLERTTKFNLSFRYIAENR